MMPKYQVVQPIQHDGEVFVGTPENPQDVSEGQFGDKKNLQDLVAAGAVIVVQDEDDLVEPPPNYRDPDLRYGGGSVLDIAPTAPTNIPVTTFSALDAKTPPPLGTTPQAEVAKKLQDLQDSGQEQIPFEDAAEQRDKDQKSGADAAKSAALGGETDAKKAQEKAPKKAAPEPVATNDEKAASPALKAGREGNTQ